MVQPNATVEGEDISKIKHKLDQHREKLKKLKTKLAAVLSLAASHKPGGSRGKRMKLQREIDDAEDALSEEMQSLSPELRQILDSPEMAGVKEPEAPFVDIEQDRQTSQIGEQAAAAAAMTPTNDGDGRQAEEADRATATPKGVNDAKAVEEAAATAALKAANDAQEAKEADEALKAANDEKEALASKAMDEAREAKAAEVTAALKAANDAKEAKEADEALKAANDEKEASASKAMDEAREAKAAEVTAALKAANDAKEAKEADEALKAANDEKEASASKAMDEAREAKAAEVTAALKAANDAKEAMQADEAEVTGAAFEAAKGVRKLARRKKAEKIPKDVDIVIDEDKTKRGLSGVLSEEEEDGEERKPKRARGPSAYQKWLDLPESEKIEKRIAGRQAFNEFLRAQKERRLVPIPLTIRNRIRTVQSFLIEAATTNRKTAVHCLTTGAGNTMCRYHQGITKKEHAMDREDDGKDEKLGEYMVTGVPGPRLLHPNVPAEGMMNCGCDEEEVLMDFFFWKTWTATSTKTGKTEGWKEQCLDPRARSFVVQAFVKATGLTVNDLYWEGRTAEQQQKAMLEKELKIIQDALKDLEDPEEVSLLD